MKFCLRVAHQKVHATPSNMVPGGRLGKHASTELNVVWKAPHLSQGKRGWIPSSMVLTPGNSPASAAENGPITSPSYGLTSPASAGTAPGTRASEIREKSPIIAKRPF